MSQLAHANSFRDLIVYQRARELSHEIFRQSAAFPKDEIYSLVSQIRRSSRSVGANIAEAWAKRRYEKHFVSKLTDADGEQQETQHWIETAADCGYWPEAVAAKLRAGCEEIGRLLHGMMDKSEVFCGAPTRSLREPTVEYFVGDRSHTSDD